MEIILKIVNFVLILISLVLCGLGFLEEKFIKRIFYGVFSSVFLLVFLMIQNVTIAMIFMFFVISIIILSISVHGGGKKNE